MVFDNVTSLNPSWNNADWVVLVILVAFLALGLLFGAAKLGARIIGYPVAVLGSMVLANIVLPYLYPMGWYQSVISALWNNKTLVNWLFYILLTIAFFVGKDWKNRTFRNQILAGHGRIRIYLTAQMTAILISLGGILLWQIILWGLGSLLRIPAFLENQFVYTTAQGKASYDPAANFCLSFFMELLIFLALTVIACAWSFIIPNSWGALGLLYATFVLFNIISTILFGVSEFNYNTYYQLQEWLFPYQLGIYSNFRGDLYPQFVYGDSNGYGSWSQVVYSGRTTALALKTTATALIGIGGMGYLGALSFVKRDLK